MSSYYREQGFSSRKRFLRRLRYIWALLLLSLVVVGGFFAYDAIAQNKKSDQASKESNTVTSLIVSNTQLQSSPYFQFQSPKNWRVIANESRSNHFVYRQYNGPLLEQELTVDINRDTPEVLALTLNTRVMPVTVTQPGKLTPTSSNPSDHCKEAAKQSRNPIVVTYKGVTFNCNPTASNFIVLVGIVGGTDNLVLSRPSGGKATYNIVYKNLTAQPTAGDLDDMIETFETR
jgi:hypothetical protein